MIISSIFTNKTCSFFKENVKYILSGLQKRTVAIAFGVFGICALICYNKISQKKPEKSFKSLSSVNKITQDNISNKPAFAQDEILTKLPKEIWFKIFENLDFKNLRRASLVCQTFNPIGCDLILKLKESEKFFLEAMDLMFTDRTLVEMFLQTPLTKSEIDQRHEDLKVVISKILPKHLNFTATYRDGMMGCQQTLLLQAITQIQDPVRRLEIVQLLLDKGADPRIQGFYYTEINPIQQAEETKDTQLIQILKDALKNYP